VVGPRQYAHDGRSSGAPSTIRTPPTVRTDIGEHRVSIGGPHASATLAGGSIDIMPRCNLRQLRSTPGLPSSLRMQWTVRLPHWPRIYAQHRPMQGADT
jgi:hypothetical protein